MLSSVNALPTRQEIASLASIVRPPTPARAQPALRMTSPSKSSDTATDAVARRASPALAEQALPQLESILDTLPVQSAGVHSSASPRNATQSSRLPTPRAPLLPRGERAGVRWGVFDDFVIKLQGLRKGGLSDNWVWALTQLWGVKRGT